MEADHTTTAPSTSNAASMGKLLDLLKRGLSDGAAAPQELASNIGRMFDDIDASISKLREMLYEHGRPV